MATEETEITASIPRALLDAIEALEQATGRGRDDIVAGAIRTYLADQRQRAHVEEVFRQANIAYPRPWAVDATVTLSTPADSTTRQLLEQTLGLINRYLPVRVTWLNDRTYEVRVGSSGFSAEDAASIVENMLRDRTVDELGLEIDEASGVQIRSIEPLD